MTTLDATPATKPCGCPELPEISRRSFLKAAGTAGVVAGLATEGMFTRLAFADGPYTGDVLVVLSFRGGMDGLQAFVPTGDSHYASLRPTIAIPQGSLLQMDPMFGMHPAMGSLYPFYQSGDFGVVQAVGMAEPNRSHFSAMEEMERAAPGSSLRTGWLDRVLGLRDPGQPFRATQMGSNSQRPRSSGPHPSWRCGRSIRSTWTVPTTAPRRRGGIRGCGPYIKVHRASSPRRPSPPWTR